MMIIDDKMATLSFYMRCLLYTLPPSLSELIAKKINAREAYSEVVLHSRQVNDVWVSGKNFKPKVQTFKKLFQKIFECVPAASTALLEMLIFDCLLQMVNRS